MPDILGLQLEDGMRILSAISTSPSVQVIETDGYRNPEERERTQETRIVGMKQNDSELVLITARF